MDQGLAAIVVATITTIGGIIVAMIHSARKENRRDHAVVATSLMRIRMGIEKTRTAIDSVEQKLDRHLADHERETEDGPARRH